MRRTLVTLAMSCLALAALATAVWVVGFGAALDRLARQGEADLALGADRLVAELQRYREVSVLLADHPSMRAVLTEESDQFVGRTDEILLTAADMTGAYAILVVNRHGLVVATSREGTRLGEVAEDFGASRHFRRAMHAALGVDRRIIDETGTRAFIYAAPIQERERPPIGAVIIAVDLEGVEAAWRANPLALFFTGADGAVFVSNRAELLFATPGGAGFPAFSERMINNHRLLRIADTAYLPAEAMHLTRALPIIGLTGEVLIDVAPARRVAFWQAAFAVAICVVLGGVIFILVQRRKVLLEILRREEAAIAQLEARVEARTLELSHTNASLLTEVHERKEAEAALRRAQAELVQAAKLSALGKMSAGISHELNQPLMAITGFAENAGTYLARGDAATATRNLLRIAELSRRMGRIIRNLRAFARQESEPATDVDIAGVIDAALEISERRLGELGVEVVWSPPKQPVIVRGGEVRLQQVMLNLFANAADAMAESDDKQLEIAVLAGDPVAVTVRDSGPGLKDADHIFDPFYTTKAIGAAEGMGLGLSISYGIVQSFGGAIAGANAPGGGAVFTVSLTPARASAAA